MPHVRQTLVEAHPSEAIPPGIAFFVVAKENTIPLRFRFAFLTT
jgi:hypothetical protein